MASDNLMTKKSDLREISCIALLVLTIFITSCAKNNDAAAKILGLEIGDSKSEVMDDLLRNAFVTHIRPDVEKFIEVKMSSKNKDELIKLLVEQPGIVMEKTSPKIFIKISFFDSLVSDIYLAPVNKGQDFGIDVGMNRNSIEKLLIEKFSRGKLDYAFNFLPRSDLIEIEKMDDKDRCWLFKNNTWSFGETNKYSSARLYFKDDRLISIDYRWTPIELP
jgi:hypothetical protein